MTTEREDAPSRLPGQSASDFILTLAKWLTEPHRRRLGLATFAEVVAAAEELETRAIHDRFASTLFDAASTRIEDLTDYDRLRANLLTVQDLNDRITDTMRGLLP